MNSIEKGEYIKVSQGEPCFDIETDSKPNMFRYLNLCFREPCQTCGFLTCFIGQQCSPCCLPLCGNEYCYNPSQNSYTHTLYVIRNTLLKWNKRWLCGCNESAGVLLSTYILDSTPRFIFNEKDEGPMLLTFKEYVDQVDDPPPFSGAYRSIDGGGNQKDYPFIGQGGRGYAKTEPYSILSVQPDTKEMCKVLMTRKDFRPAIHGVNALATWVANLAIHDLFRSDTTHNKPWVNKHSSYLDLQVLYGYNIDIANQTRLWSKGYLKSYAEDRLKRVPESEAILELLRREHNVVCDELAKRYPEQFKDDEALYQQARLIMGGVYINIILRSYGSIMFSENAPNGKAFAELRQRYPGKQFGNHNSLNFNILYQWHNTIPEEWDPKVITPIDTDDQLRDLFNKQLQWNSGAFGSNNTPSFLVHVSERLIQYARQCGAPRMNDFRRTLNLSPYKDFKDLCDDEETAKQLHTFYPSIEDVELVVGIQVEKCVGYGWGLNKTVSSVIIADAFSTIVNDRFYTDDYTPERYTEWGYQHTQNTILVDLLNKHLGLNINRNIHLEKMMHWVPPSF